jgi:deoxyribodipyrimidine photolyase-related protein
MAYKRLALILGNCLFPDHDVLAPDDQTLFFMAEDSGLCTHFRYHKQKLVLFLSSMRSHADEIRNDHHLYYQKLAADNFELSYESKLEGCLNEHQEISEVITYDIEDHFFRRRIQQFCRKKDLKLITVPSSGFLTTQSGFKAWIEDNKPFMQSFYQWQRKRLQILVTEDNKPEKGKWSFDAENRKSLPDRIAIPAQPKSQLTNHDREVMELVNNLFEDHPGTTENFNWSTTRRSALYRLDHFLKENFENFGPYEDAIHHSENFLFHSVLSPYINLGLITPTEILERILDTYHKEKTHFSSVEGFVRQLIGWREFIRGIYNNYDLEKNEFGHQRKMKDCWYEGNTGIPPLDDSIKKATRYGYTHHIERLMILGNIMLMTELDPKEVYRWFMEMYVDSSDWVMAPNVFDMSQFATGGIFATKPYIAGSNYILKMSNYAKGPWCDIMNGLYWRFIERHRETFANNFRMRMMLGTLDKMKPEKKEYLFARAEEWVNKVSVG